MSSRPKIATLDDKEVITAFVEFLGQSSYPDLTVDDWPDTKNRNTKDIDALAGPFAIEHTRIDTISNQTRDSVWFLHVAGGLEAKFSTLLNYRLDVIFPYDGVCSDQNWPEIRESLATWLTKDSPDLPEGGHTLCDLPGIPFQLIVKKFNNRAPRLTIYRTKPEESNTSKRIKTHLLRKANKLIRYQDIGFTTIMLIESDDIALMNEAIMLDNISKAFSRSLPAGVNQVWFVDSSITSNLCFYDFTRHLKTGQPAQFSD